MSKTAAQAAADAAPIPSFVSTRSLDVRRAVGRDALGAWEMPWRLLDRQAGPVQQFDWAAIGAEYTAARRVEAIGVWCGDELTAAVPLGLKRIGGVSRLLMLGVDEQHEPMDLLAADAEALDALARALASDGRPMILGRIPGPTPTIDAVRRAMVGRGLLFERPQASYPYIPLDASWVEPEAHLNSGRRSDFRRMRRKAEACGPVEVEIARPMPDQLDALLDEAFAVEAKSWKGIAGTALCCDPEQAAHTRRYAHAACRSGILRMCFLRIGGRAVAMQIAMQQGGGFWLLKIGYDAGFAHCSPGQLLLREAIAHAAREGLKTFEFLGQSEPWIEVWTSHRRDCTALRLYPYTAHGLAALSADAAALIRAKAIRRAAAAGSRLREFAKRATLPVVKLAARCYIAGDQADDAARVAEGLRRRGIAATIGFWDTESQSARQVADEYRAGIERLTRLDERSYLSVKLPALRFNQELLEEVAAAAHAGARRIHFDSHGPEVADRKRTAVEALLERRPDSDLGFTLPGRWSRSSDDADWACARRLFVRVVKGQWEDPLDPHRDPRSGYLEVVRRLAGRARRVAVATHDPRLAEEAATILVDAGTPCELELLHGLPMRGCLAVARRLKLDVRVYVPYGEAYMPYALSQMRKNPRIAWWIVKDGAASLASKLAGCR